MFWMGTQANYSSSIHYLLNFFILFLFFINSSLILDRQQLRPSFSMRLDTRFWCCVCIFLLLFLFFLLRSARMLSVSGSRALCTGPNTSLTSKISGGQWFSVDPVYCSRDSQTYFFYQNFIKNGSHGTIPIFKNYFVIMFSVFSKINDIQINDSKILTITRAIFYSAVNVS